MSSWNRIVEVTFLKKELILVSAVSDKLDIIEEVSRQTFWARFVAYLDQQQNNRLVPRWEIALLTLIIIHT